jgi:hypothetical protein
LALKDERLVGRKAQHNVAKEERSRSKSQSPGPGFRRSRALNRSMYTTITVDPKSRLLKPTESITNLYNSLPEKKTIVEEKIQFEKSMRSYDYGNHNTCKNGSALKALNSSTSRSRSHQSKNGNMQTTANNMASEINRQSQSYNVNYSNSNSDSNISSSIVNNDGVAISGVGRVSKGIPAVLPFPAHLVHHLRPQNKNTEDESTMEARMKEQREAQHPQEHKSDNSNDVKQPRVVSRVWGLHNKSDNISNEPSQSSPPSYTTNKTTVVSPSSRKSIPGATPVEIRKRNTVHGDFARHDYIPSPETLNKSSVSPHQQQMNNKTTQSHMRVPIRDSKIKYDLPGDQSEGRERKNDTTGIRVNSATLKVAQRKDLKSAIGREGILSPASNNNNCSDFNQVHIQSHSSRTSLKSPIRKQSGISNEDQESEKEADHENRHENRSSNNYGHESPLPIVLPPPPPPPILPNHSHTMSSIPVESQEHEWENVSGISSNGDITAQRSGEEAPMIPTSLPQHLNSRNLPSQSYRPFVGSSSNQDDQDESVDDNDAERNYNHSSSSYNDEFYSETDVSGLGHGSDTGYLPAPKPSGFGHMDEQTDKTNYLGQEIGPKGVPIIPRKHALNRDRLKARLANGMEAVKHGRGGHQRVRKIRYDSLRKELRWKSTDDFLSMSGLFRDMENATKGISLMALIEVRRGIQTEILSYTGKEDPSCCVSLITSERTLDLKFGSKNKRDEFIRALQIVIEELHLIDQIKFL